MENHDVNKIIGQKIRYIRELENQTREEFSDETGMKVGTLRHVEAGKHLPRFTAMLGVFHSERYQKYTSWVIFGGDFEKVVQIDPSRTLEGELLE